MTRVSCPVGFAFLSLLPSSLSTGPLYPQTSDRCRIGVGPGVEVFGYLYAAEPSALSNFCARMQMRHTWERGTDGANG